MWSVAKDQNEKEATAGQNRTIHTALALDLDKDGEVSGGLAVPRREGLEQLETFRLGVDRDLNGGTVLRRGLEGVLARVVATRREFVSGGVGELERLAVSALKGVGQGVEGQVSSKGHSSDDIRGSDECVGSGVGIITTSEVTVVRGDDYKEKQR